MNRIYGVTMAVALALVTACSGPKSDGLQQEAQAAVKTTNQYMDALMAGNIDAASQFYSKEFFKTRGEEEWRAFLKDVEAQHGKMLRYEVSDQQTDVRYSGTFYIVFYRVWYEKNKKSSPQIVTMVSPVNGGPTKIYAHKIEFEQVPVIVQ